MDRLTAGIASLCISHQLILVSKQLNLFRSFSIYATNSNAITSHRRDFKKTEMEKSLCRDIVKQENEKQPELTLRSLEELH